MTAWPLVPLGELLTKSEEWVKLDPFGTYKQVTVKLWGHGVIERNTVQGHEIGSDTRFVVRTDQFVISRIDARNGASGVVPKSLDGAVVSSDFPTFTVNRNKLEPQFFNWYSKTARFVEDCKAASEGTTNRVRLKEDRFLAMSMPLPLIDEQRWIVERVNDLFHKTAAASRLAAESTDAANMLCDGELARIMEQQWQEERSLGELLSENSLNGLPAHPSLEPPGHSILRISAATTRSDFVINEGESRFLQIADSEAAKHSLQPGDLLACRFNGNLRFVGRFALYTGYSRVPQVYPDKLIRFRINKELASPEYICLAMNSRQVRARVEGMCATTAGNIGIAASDLKTVRLPVPSLNVQGELVRRFRTVQCHVGSLMNVVRLREVELRSLVPSVLNQAFSGQL
jgi:type I restriction enzyme S subunit